MKNNTLTTRYLLVLFAIGIALLFAAGCTSDEPSGVKVTETTITAELTPGPAGEAVHYTELTQFLPIATSNWDASEPYGMQVSDGTGSWSWVENQYVNKDGIATVDIVLQDTAGAIVGYQTVLDSYIEMDTPELKVEKVTVQGYPGWIVTDKMEDIYTQLIDVNDRFIVWTQVTGGKKDYITVFNSMMDLKTLAALG